MLCQSYIGSIAALIEASRLLYLLRAAGRMELELRIPENSRDYKTKFLSSTLAKPLVILCNDDVSHSIDFCYGRCRSLPTADSSIVDSVATGRDSRGLHISPDRDV